MVVVLNINNMVAPIGSNLDEAQLYQMLHKHRKEFILFLKVLHKLKNSILIYFKLKIYFLPSPIDSQHP